MKRFHLATVLVVGTVCVCVCVCVCTACIYSILCVYYLKVNDKRTNLTRGRENQSLGRMKEGITAQLLVASHQTFNTFTFNVTRQFVFDTPAIVFTVELDEIVSVDADSTEK